MDRKLFGIFSGWQLTIMFVVALFVPGALYATVTTTAVSITDPNTGAKSLVDGSRLLWVYDAYAGYANNPRNYVRISTGCNSSNEFTQIYTPPSGKALIIRSVDIHYFDGVSGGDNYLYLYLGGDYPFASVESMDVVSSRTIELGNGYFVSNGEQIYQQCSSSSGSYYATIVGYLVPASLAPATSAAAAQSVQVGAPGGKGGRRF